MRSEDGYIVSQCLNGDSAAFGLLVEKYKAGVYALAYSRLRNFQDAEDITQEVFIKAYQKLGNLKRWDRFISWLYIMTSNLCRDFFRAEKRRLDRDSVEDQEAAVLEAQSIKTHQKELIYEMLNDALDSLPETYRDVLTLYYLGDMNSREIAGFLGISPTAVRQRLARGRIQLKEGILDMMSTTFKQEKLQSSFTFHIVEAVKRIKIHPIPRETMLPWGISIATCIIMAIIGLGDRLNMSKSIIMDTSHSMKITAMDDVIAPVDILDGFQIPTNTHSRGFDNQNTYLLAEGGNISGKPARASMASFQQENKNVDLVWRDQVGTATEVSVVDNHAYLCAGFALVVLDMSNPNKPTQVGYLELPDRAIGIHISGNYAYIAAFQSGVHIVDILNPDTPKEVGFWNISGYIYDIYVDGSYAYAIDYNGKLYIIDISDIQNPKKVGECDIPKQATGIYVVNGFAYIAAGDAHLRIIDVSDPKKPREVSFFNTPKRARDIFVNDNYAYIANEEAGLRVIDISDPQNPEEVGFYDSPGYTTGVYVAGSYAYLGDFDNGFYIIDISNPKNPRKVGNCNPPGYETKVYVADGQAYVTDFNAGGLQVIDVSDSANPREMGFYDTPGSAWGLYADKGYAYIAEGNGGIRIMDVSDPNSPKARGTWESPGYARKIHVVDDYAYVADLGFYAVDVSDPDNPRTAGRSNTQWALYGVYVSENYAYVTGAGLLIIDVSNPKKPLEVGLFSFPEMWGGGVYVKGKYAYITEFNTGLHIIDVSNPRSPREIGSCSIPESALSVHVLNNYAYMPSYKTGLNIVDVSDPKNPEVVGSFKPDFITLRDVYVSGNYAYLAADNLHVIDIANPKNPEEVGFYQTRSYLEDIQFADGLVYAAGGSGGLYILKPDIAGMPVEKTGKLPGTWGEAKRTVLLQNFPNPFNPETWIPYQLSEDTDVAIRIYDVSGNLVRTLELGRKPKGSYISKDKAAYWDGKNEAGEIVASDVYFCVMKAGEIKELKKMVMVR